MDKNDILEVNIIGYTSEGYGVCKPQGYVLFVPGLLRGERAVVRVVKAGRSFGYARAEKIIERSPRRAEPRCETHRLCGGCGLWHMSEDEELEFKRQKVKNALYHAGYDIDPGTPLWDGRVDGCRNKAQYPVREQGGRVKIGFFRRGSHDIAEGDCITQPRVFGDVADTVRAFMLENGVPAYNETTGGGAVRHIFLRGARDMSEIMLCLVVNGAFSKKAELVKTVTARHPQISSVLLNYNDKNTNVILGDRFETLYGRGYITDTLCGLRFEIAPSAFYQVNHGCCELLYGAAREFANAGGLSALDLYCGIGTVGLCAMGDARRLVGIETVAEAVKCAEKNAARNGFQNARFVAGDAADAAALAGGGFDIIAVDPPRSGCDRRTLDFLCEQKPKRLIYISCDCATLARDLKILREGGLELAAAKTVNMFPRTAHIETVTLLKRR